MRTVIVTDFSSGIGYDIARAFFARGDNVVMNGRSSEKLAAAAGALRCPDRVVAVPGDIGSRATGEALVGAAAERFGGLDVLVSNAGTLAPKPFLDVKFCETSWRCRNRASHGC